MTSLSYDEIFSDFLGAITDYGLIDMDQSDAYMLMSEYLHKALAQTYVRRLFSYANIDDEIQTFSYELETVVDENADLDFVRYILHKGMIVAWLEPQVRSKLNISQAFMGKEQKFYSQSAHLAELRGLLEDTQLDLRKTIRDRGYIYNSYLEES